MNSKLKGNAFERECAFRLREIFPDCRTSRFMGRLFDDYNGIDLTGTGNFNIQCKAVERLHPGYHEILSKMPHNGATNIVVHKKNNKGIVVVITFQDFMNLLKNMGGENRSRKRVPIAIGE